MAVNKEIILVENGVGNINGRVVLEDLYSKSNLRYFEAENDLWERHIWQWYANELLVEGARRRETLKRQVEIDAIAWVRTSLDEIRKTRNRIDLSPTTVSEGLGQNMKLLEWNWTFSLLKDLIARRRKRSQLLCKQVDLVVTKTRMSRISGSLLVKGHQAP